MSRFRRNMNGFTVVELIVAVALTGIATAAVYKSFSAQQSVYTAQGQVVDLQQNLRAGTDLLVRELRMAGCDPSTRASAGFVTANALTVRFTMNFDDDDDVSDEGEDITYSLFILGGVKCLGRK
ncbi:MAG: prepilin-type N-terminal cleavage/methylation domain-containing protein, partial [Desulfobacteraceae bacterium]|nr:prepilin-type N-terminal cleavage/methylation domain-containing protein [Desulfobacteraceae bacterium]